MARLAEKALLVTGAAGGIGTSSIHRLVEEGASVLATDVADAPDASIQPMIDAGKVVYRQADLTDEKESDRVVEEAVRLGGRLDGLFCVHGISEAEAFLDADIARLDRMWAVNVRSVFLACRAAARVMVQHGGGAIVNVSSSSALRASPTLVAYGATKSAVIQMSRSMAAELAADRVRVNVISPGIIDTPMPRRAIASLPEADRRASLAAMAAMAPMGRLGTPDEIAHLGVYLLSDESSFTTGAVVPADGGISVG